jgi:uncharacterized protein YPO0396
MIPNEQGQMLDGASEQFRLTRLQTYNWGTFSGVFDFQIPADGYLFVGPSGSGKSTLLDAHAALLTPPKWVGFNVAARQDEKHAKDRNVMTYLRGAWAQQTGDTGEYLEQYLRDGTTWSAIAETYQNALGRCIVLAQLHWVRGSTTAPTEVKHLYMVLERAFDLRELEIFAKNDFDVRRLKHELADANILTEFSAYQERFRRLLGIENERALRLLHKTQSAKNLGDLNVFLRDFMLDAPETFDIADRLVSEFVELNEAHQAVVAARRQIEVLKPARADHTELQSAKDTRTNLQALQEALGPYREGRRTILLEARIAEQQTSREASRQKTLQLADTVAAEYEALRLLEGQKSDLGADVLDRLQQEIDAAEREKPERMRKRDLAAAACSAMGWAMPDVVEAFVERVALAKQTVMKAKELREDVERRKDALKDDLRKFGLEFTETNAEIKAMESQRSNLPARLVAVRAHMALELDIPEERLPFVGELLEVKPDAADWQGAIERVLGGFARSILVDEKHYGQVSAYLNGRNIGERLAYFRVMSQSSANSSLRPNSLVHKLKVAPGQYASWLYEELKTHFDFECAETLAAFKAAMRAVTREGQVKHNTTRHEKNDRTRIDDRSLWVLGFDNKAKLALFKAKAQSLGSRYSELQAAISDLSMEEDKQESQRLYCQTLANLVWKDVDVGELLTRVSELQKRVADERKARPDLAKLESLIERQEAKHRAVMTLHSREEAEGNSLEKDIQRLQKKLSEVQDSLLSTPLPAVFRIDLDARYLATAKKAGKDVTLDSLDQLSNQVLVGVGAELRDTDARISVLTGRIIRNFEEFKRLWPNEAANMDTTLESAADFFQMLSRLESDGLPKFEERFMSLLKEQSDQNLTLLRSKLGQERSAIRSRMEVVNESLESAPFNENTHLVIETQDKSIEEVRLFFASLTQALSHTFSADPEVAEQRFVTLAALVKRLSSQESFDKKWRDLVLDVRQHVEFVARELNADGDEVEIYRSGAGKSGGQRQKLAATCLAAALRYQLGGQDRSLPAFSTVVLDEAFDKADAEFTAMAMNIFKTFGFQMIVATPMKSVMTLEPFIGGACFVHIKDRKKSAVIPIEYDQQAHRLKLSPDVQNVEEAAIS